MAGIDRIRDEMAKSAGQTHFLGEGITALIGLYPGTESLFENKGKTLAGCLDAIRKAAKNGVADPVTSTEAICKYYGLEFTDYRKLAAEVNLALCSDAQTGVAPVAQVVPVASAAPDIKPQTHAETLTPGGFDLDALLEGL